jgi:hypothetical protein
MRADCIVISNNSTGFLRCIFRNAKQLLAPESWPCYGQFIFGLPEFFSNEYRPSGGAPRYHCRFFYYAK